MLNLVQATQLHSKHFEMISLAKVAQAPARQLKRLSATVHLPAVTAATTQGVGAGVEGWGVGGRAAEG